MRVKCALRSRRGLPMAGWARVLSLAIVLLVTSCDAANAAGRRPVVFIPGIIGSSLVYRDGAAGIADKIVWGDYFATRANFGFLAYPPDPSKDKVLATGVLDSFSILGPLSVGAYGGIEQLLKTDLGSDYYPFAYNWRQSNFRTADDLRRFIDRNPALLKSSRGDGIIIVAHSMGGIVARLFIDKYGAQYRVSRLITIATPYYGSVQALQSFLVGMSDYWKYINSDDATVRRIYDSIPSVYELLPRYTSCCFDANHHPFDATDIKVWERQNWIPHELQSSQGRAFLAAALASAARIGHAMDQPVRAGVQTFFIAGYGNSMPREVDLAPAGPPRWTDGSEGDGTVYRWSAVSPRQEAALPMLVAQTHTGLLDDPDVRRQIVAQVVDDRSPEQFVTAGPATQMTFGVKTQTEGEKDATALAIDLPSAYLPAGSQQTAVITVSDPDGHAIGDAIITAALEIEGKEAVPLPLIALGSGFKTSFTVPVAGSVCRLKVTAGPSANFDRVFAAIPAD